MWRTRFHRISRGSPARSARINDLIRDQPYLRGVLPEPGTIDRLGDTNSALLIEKLSSGLSDFTMWVLQGFIILVLVIFLLVEGPMLTSKVVRFFAKTSGEADKTSAMLTQVTRKIRAFLVARTLINLCLGLVVALGLWCLNVHFALFLGLFAALTNFVPYIGQLIGGAVPTAIALGQTGSIGDALIVAAMYLAVVGIEGYVVTPLVMGRSLDLNGTTVLIACLFWGYLWGLIGLVLAMPITVSLKLVFQAVPELNQWAELMSLDWRSPGDRKPRGRLSRPSHIASAGRLDHAGRCRIPCAVGGNRGGQFVQAARLTVRLPFDVGHKEKDSKSEVFSRKGGINDGSRPRILRSLKLRTACRQFDGQVAAAIQAGYQPIRDDSLEGGMFRAHRGRPAPLLEAADRLVP